MLEEKGEFNLAIGTGSSLDLVGSYAISDNIGVIASLSDTYTTEISTTDLSNNKKVILELPNNKYEAAVGYLNNIDEKFYYSGYLGYAFGKSGSINDDFFDGISFLEFGYTSNFNGPFIQSAMHAKVSDEFSIGLIGRLNSFQFTDFKYSSNQQVNSDFIKDKNNLIGQIGLDLKLKGEFISYFFQAQYSFDDNSEKFFTTRKNGFYGGVSFRIDYLYNN